MKPEDLYIVKENPFEIQKKCQTHSREIFGAFFIGMLIYFALTELIPNILGVFFPKGYIATLVAMRNIPSDVIDLSTIVDTPIITLVYALFFNGIFEVGKALYALTFIRNRKVEYTALGEGFSLAIKAFLLMLVQTLVISLWTMFFIIPGFIAIFNYSQSYYILADDPSKGVFRVMAESKTRMRGNKMNLLRLDVSYFLSIFIGLIPVTLFQSFDIEMFKSQPLVGVLVEFIISIPLYYALSIMVMGQTTFYELLINHGFENFKFKGQDAFRQSIFANMANFTNRSEDKYNPYNNPSNNANNEDGDVSDNTKSVFGDDLDRDPNNGIVTVETDDIEVINDNTSTEDTKDSDQQ